MSERHDPGGYFPIVYDELRRLAASKLSTEAAGHSLDSTALVHEAFLRLGEASFDGQSGFFRAAAVAMQRILVEHARRKKSAKRGGARRRFELVDSDRVILQDDDMILDLNEALNRLSREDHSSAEVARLRLFGGMTIDEAAAALGISRATGFREWAYARSWLTVALNHERNNPRDDQGEADQADTPGPRS